MKLKALFVTFVLLLSGGVHADLKSKLKGLLGEDEETDTTQAESADLLGLSSEQQIEGLKQALAQGFARAVGTLGKEDGFWGNELVQIPLPETVDRVAKGARRLGGDRYVDEFHETLNRAAENAVPVATDLFAAALRDMTVDDAIEIIRGEPDAATRYFRGRTEASLVEQFLPMVAEATDDAGVTQAYKQLNKKVGGFLAALGGDEDSLDLDRYVTNKALDALFVYIAAEEKQIREDPIARTTDLLKALFD